MAQELVTSLVGKVVSSLFGIAIKEISYMSNYSKNVEDLKEKHKKLTEMMDCIVDEINAAKKNGDRLKKGVEEWVVKAESHISDAKEVIDGVEANANISFNLRMCTDLVTLHSQGKKVVDTASLLDSVHTDGKPFESCVFLSTHTPKLLDSCESKYMDGLVTHKLCIKKIMESIEDDSKQIIGIYGIGGVGKTTLAKEVALTVKSSFDDVEFIMVSQKLNVERMKKEVESAAKRIKKGDKILVILDDVWEELKLDELGISCGANNKNCKILVTSRRKDVCERMNGIYLIRVDSLKKEEAWILFKYVVGNDVVEADENLKRTAHKVVEGCGGLPLIIQAVGETLKNESIESWKRTLTQLQKHTTSFIDPKISLAYSHLQLSYDSLESEEAKLCLLLCSMFPQDSDIPLERLAYYGVGLESFDDINSMEDARNRVRHALKILKYACLLLDGKDESTVKMHVVVREVALLIASKGDNRFLVNAGTELTEWKPRTKNVKSCKGISLVGNRIGKLPDYELEIPLDIFLIQGNDLSAIPDKFILGLKEARIIDFEANQIICLPQSLEQLKKLCVLNLGGNESLGDISILGVLKSLEILILSNTGIVEIPQEMGNLVHLRRLEVKGCPGLIHIAPNVMSKLHWLEELHIAYYRVEDGNNEGLMEIGELPMLTFLDLFVPHAHLIPKGACFTKLKGFVIQIGGRSQIYDIAEVVYKKTLILGMEHLDTSQVKEWIELSDGIFFDWVVNQNNILPTEYRESWYDLTTITLYRCCNLLSLVDSSDRNVDEELSGENTKKKYFSKLEHLFLLSLDMLRSLWKCPDQHTSLENLVTLHISDCNKLVRLFSVNAARGLVKLKTLTIHRCRSLKEVIWVGVEGDTDRSGYVVFRRLVKIELSYLKKLKSFYAEKVIIKFPSLKQVEIYGCDIMEKWGSKRNYDTPNLKHVNQQHSSSIGQDGFRFRMNGNKYYDQVMRVVGLTDRPEEM